MCFRLPIVSQNLGAWPGDDGYDASRTVWNAMIDRRPALVVHCAGVNDIKQAVDFARTHGLLTSVKGGGHNIAGSAVCDGGLLLDLSGMRSVRIDPGAHVAHVEPGATLGDFDSEAQAFGLATPICSGPYGEAAEISVSSRGSNSSFTRLAPAS